MKLWVVIAAIKAAFKTFALRVSVPLSRVHSWDWSNCDHKHICYAARILEKDDFQKVCRHIDAIRKDPLLGAECCDACDGCKYAGVVSFVTDEDGKKSVDFWFPE